MTIHLPYNLEEHGVQFHLTETNGIKLNVAAAGEGPPVFLIHGFPESWASWGPQISFLVEHGYKAVVPEMRGYGDSDAPDAIEAYDTVELAKDLKGLIEAFGQEKGVIIGHDWGAIVSWYTAWLHPESVKGLGALSVPFFPRGKQPILAAMKKNLGDRYFYILDFQRQELTDQLNADIGLSLRTMLTGSMDQLAQDESDRRFLDRIRVPEQPPSHMPPDFLEYIVTRFQRHGFGPPLNWYRNYDRTWERTEGADNVVHPPVMYLTGISDWSHQYHKALGLDLNRQCPDLRIYEETEATHWLGQEKPEMVNSNILTFLKSLDH